MRLAIDVREKVAPVRLGRDEMTCNSRVSVCVYAVCRATDKPERTAIVHLHSVIIATPYQSLTLLLCDDRVVLADNM